MWNECVNASSLSLSSSSFPQTQGDIESPCYAIRPHSLKFIGRAVVPTSKLLYFKLETTHASRSKTMKMLMMFLEVSQSWKLTIGPIYC